MLKWILGLSVENTSEVPLDACTSVFSREEMFISSPFERENAKIKRRSRLDLARGVLIGAINVVQFQVNTPLNPSLDTTDSVSSLRGEVGLVSHFKYFFRIPIKIGIPIEYKTKKGRIHSIYPSDNRTAIIRSWKPSP